jgi:hypothetical protein
VRQASFANSGPADSRCPAAFAEWPPLGSFFGLFASSPAVMRARPPQSGAGAASKKLEAPVASCSGPLHRIALTRGRSPQEARLVHARSAFEGVDDAIISV